MMEPKSRSDRDMKGLAKIAAQQLSDPSGPSVAIFDIGGFDTMLIKEETMENTQDS